MYNTHHLHQNSKEKTEKVSTTFSGRQSKRVNRKIAKLLLYRPRSYIGEQTYSSTYSESWHLMEVCSQLHVPAALLAGKEHPIPIE
jgi:hypothetical protein